MQTVKFVLEADPQLNFLREFEEEIWHVNVA